MALANNVVANYAAQAVRILVGVGLVPLYIRFLGAESFGLVSLFALLQLWMTFVDVGLKPAVTREIARFSAGAVKIDDLRDLIRSAEVLLLCIAALCAFSVWLASGWLAQHWLKAEVLTPETVERAVALMGVATAMRVIEILYINSLSAFQRQVTESVLSISVSLIRGFGSLLAIVFIHRSVEAYFIAQAVASLIGMAAYAWFVYGSMPSSTRPARFSIEALRSVWRFAGSAALLTVATLASLQVDKVLLSKILTLEDFGYYGLAGVTANVLQAAAVPLVAAFYPRLTELVSRGDEAAVRRTYQIAVQLTSVIMGSMGIAIVVFSDVIIAVWTQQPDLSTRVALPAAFLTLAVMFQCLYWMPQYIQMAHGWVGLSVKAYVIAVVAIIPLVIVAGIKFGGVGASAVLALVHLVTLLVAVRAMHMRLMVGDWLHWLIVGTGVPLGAAALVAMIGRSLMPEWGDLGRLFWVMGTSATMLVVSAAAAPDLRRNLARIISDRLEATLNSASR